MKRNIYITLIVLALILLGYTLYYMMTHTQEEVSPIVTVSLGESATTTIPVVEDKTIHTTPAGKKIKLTETNPVGESLSTITITTTGFSTNTPIVLETNKLTNSFYVDLNKDSYEELIMTTMAQGSGSFGEVYIFTTASNTQLLSVKIPEITEDETKKGALFEGYMGHDSFTLVNNTLLREFPTYKKTDVLSEPTGPRRSVVYSLSEKNGAYFIDFIKNTTTSLLPVTATSTKKEVASTTP